MSETKKDYKIAVVDDEQDILDNYVDLLSAEYEVHSFNNPQDFIKALDENKIPSPDLLVTDLKMPALTGLEMVKQAQKKGFHFPFILLSGYLDKDAAIEAMDAGAFRLLEKPTDSDVLLATVDQLLLEHQIINVRKEIRSLTEQLRELYSGIRMIMQQYIPEDVLNRLIVEAPDGTVKKKMSFEDVLEQLEHRLEKLLKSEKVLTEMKANPFKSEEN